MMEISHDKLYVFTPFSLANPEMNGYNTRAKSQDYSYFLTSSPGKFFPLPFDFSVNKIRSESEGDVIAPANMPSAFADLAPP
jgi:hypothetical protein